MKTRLYIISKNNVSTDFWELYVNKQTTDIFKFKSLEMLNMNIKENAPSVIIIDEYFTDESNTWIRSILKHVLNSKHEFKLYVISSRFADLNSPYQLTNSINGYPFNSDFITDLNLNLNTTISLTA